MATSPWVSNMECSKELDLCQVGDLCSDGGLVPTQFSSGILCIIEVVSELYKFPSGQDAQVQPCSPPRYKLPLGNGHEAVALPIVLLWHVASGLGSAAG